MSKSQKSSGKSEAVANKKLKARIGKFKNNKMTQLFPVFVIVFLAVIIYFAFFSNSVPRGWVKHEPIPGHYSLYLPSDWQVESGDTYWYAHEQVDNINYYEISIGGSTPIAYYPEGASLYGSLWIAKVGINGKVYAIEKQPLCTEKAKTISIAGGYYSCDNSDHRAIAVAIDISDFAKDYNRDYALEGRAYEALSIECRMQDSNKYDLEKTCEQIIKTFSTTKEF